MRESAATVTDNDIYALVTDQMPWVPITDEVSARPVRFFADGTGWVSIVRVQPGGRVSLHQHTGDVQGFILHGMCRYNDHDELLAGGTYVHESDKTIDEIHSVGDEPLEILFVVSGPTVEYLNSDGQVVHTENQQSKRAAYERFCQAEGIRARPLDH